MSLDVLLLTDEDDFGSALPALDSVAQTVRRAALSGPDDTSGGAPHAVDVAIIDARTNLVAARAVCRRLTAGSPALAVVAVVAPADFSAVDVDWNFDDVMLPAAGRDELQARLRLAISRRRSVVNGVLKFGDLMLHPASFTATLGGHELHLTLTEFKLLSFLVQNAGRAFSRTRLMHEAWGYDCTGRVRTVDVHVRRLRAKLGAEHGAIVETVRGVGYMVSTPPQPEWVLEESAPTPLWTSVPTLASESVTLEPH
ncbi:winged helix-turn-helix domain-containing protein [Mycobacterium parmense]|nr:response regulator transcription factor [Mycobacterium parmense]MCV7351517.1 response regulator transcription factor [Mycobacterium parmense]ORW57488.1 transcriptional regulator [Mycobacterium parmense]